MAVFPCDALRGALLRKNLEYVVVPPPLSIALVLRIGVVSYIIDMLTFGLIMGSDPEYQHARREGWHPFWSTVPPPFNPDCEPLPPTGYFCPKCRTPHPSSWGVCQACGYGSSSVGLAESQHQVFVPPAHWQYCCPVCGARVEKQILRVLAMSLRSIVTGTSEFPASRLRI